MEAERRCIKKWRICFGGLDFLLAACFAVFIWKMPAEPRDGVTAMIGGIPADNGNVLELLALGRWLFLLAALLLIVGGKLYAERKIAAFALSRYGGFAGWWRSHFFRAHMTSAIAFVVMCAVWALCKLLDGKTGAESAEAFLAFFLHAAALTSVLTLGDFAFRRNFLPGVLLIAEGMSYVCSVWHDAPYLACGMYARCSVTENGGAAFLIYALEAAVAAGCYFLAPLIWKMKC